MKIINHCEIIEACDGTSLLLNTFTGEILVLAQIEADFVKKWIGKPFIMNISYADAEVINQLKEYQFIIQDEFDENELDEAIMSKCKREHEQLVLNSSSAIFVVTYGCNFACPYCYENAVEEHDNAVMTNEMADAIFNLYNNNIQNIGLYGGEPFLPHTRSIIKHIVSRAPNAKYSATTNGYYLTEFLDILNSVEVSQITVTLDGTKEIHNKTRILRDGRPTYERILQGVELSLQSNKRIKIRMNISPENVNDCMNLREELIIKYSTYYNSGNLTFELQSLFQLSDAQKKILNEQIIFNPNKTESLYGRYNMITLSVSPILQAFLGRRNKFTPQYCFCGAGSTQRFYDVEGNIYSCILALKNKKAAIGSYYPFYYMKPDNMLTRNIETLEKCRKCKFKYVCGGGCAYSVIDESGNVMRPNCAILTEIYETLPKLYANYIRSNKRA